MKGIFKGLRILDFTWVVVGPRTVRYLGDQGATVIKVENVDHPCILRQSPPYKDGKSGINRSSYFAGVNPNKMSIGLNIWHPEGIQIAKKLVAWADVLVESFAPGVIERFGLGYKEVKSIKPDIIYLRTNMLGASGPRSKVPGFGFQLVGYSGYTYITGWGDRTPAPPFGPYTDSVAPRFTTAVLLLALIHRRKTGKGAYIDVSQHEAAIQFILPVLLDYQVNSRIKGREGNYDYSYCPHGVYACKGKDRWVAISVTTEEEWTAFCQTVSRNWGQNDRFATLHGRKQNEDELNCLIERFTIEHTPEETMKLLQDKGVPAGIVQNSQDICNDPQLSHRQAIWYLEHESTGRHAVFGQGFILSKNPPPPPKAAPHIGEHTYYVCKEILGMPDEEIATLLGKGVLQIMM
jgi:benzylsuccinate CoA-transferase BbsF subunit